ncbi:hypothetical protein H5410_003758 [Solanum commersonii]|uniref:Uncharacterized protein n=1 Tax=Solanum commersonii TaxID=4109 RepID=A0A9J6B5T9_SOLCO|nr:hypothetical protein H5410_003758 [Solanum commersonii]
MDWLGVLVVHPRYFVWIDHEERDELNGMFYNLMHVDEYNMLAPHGQIRVEHDRVHEMINDAFGVQGGMKPEQYFDEAPNEEARFFYDQLEESSRPLFEGIDVELETTLQHPQHILEDVSDDEIMNVDEEISENDKNESFDDEEWDDNENETTEEEEWENDGIKTKCINHDTHLYVVPLDATDPRVYYPNYRRPIGASSTSQALPPRRYKDIPLHAIYRARPLLVGMISDCTPSPTSTSP